jgi:hypothetical protein
MLSIAGLCPLPRPYSSWQLSAVVFANPPSSKIPIQIHFQSQWSVAAAGWQQIAPTSNFQVPRWELLSVSRIAKQSAGCDASAASANSDAGSVWSHGGMDMDDTDGGGSWRFYNMFQSPSPDPRFQSVPMAGKGAGKAPLGKGRGLRLSALVSLWSSKFSTEI